MYARVTEHNLARSFDAENGLRVPIKSRANFVFFFFWIRRLNFNKSIVCKGMQFIRI